MWVARSVKVGAVQKPRQVHDWANQSRGFRLPEVSLLAPGRRWSGRCPFEPGAALTRRAVNRRLVSLSVERETCGAARRRLQNCGKGGCFDPSSLSVTQATGRERRHVLPWVCASRLFPADAVLSTLQGSHCHACRPARRTIGIPEAQKDAVIRRVKGHCSRPRHKHRERRGGTGSNRGRDTAGRR